MNRYPFHQPLGPASGAIRDLACRVPTPQFPRGPPMMQGNMGHQPLQHQPSSGQPPYNQGPLPPQAQQQQQGYLGPTHGQEPASRQHSPKSAPNDVAASFSPNPTAVSGPEFPPATTAATDANCGQNEGSPVPQIASPSLSQQAISNIPPIDPPALQHRNTPENRVRRRRRIIPKDQSRIHTRKCKNPRREGITRKSSC